MGQEIQAALEKLNKWFSDKFPYILYMARSDEINYLEKNARFMTKEQFASLARNIKSDGAMTSLPLCYRQENGKILILSGNHRIKASIEAGINEFLVLLIDKPMTEQQLIAIQLSHNAISGQDDMQILKELWQKIDDLDASIYSALPVEMIEKLNSMDFPAIAEQRIIYQEVSLLFLPEEIEELSIICKSIVESSRAKAVFVGRITEYNKILDGIIGVKQEHKIINSALAFFAMARAIKEYMDGRAETIQEALSDGAEDTVVFVIGGTRKRIGKAAAKHIRKIIKDKMDTGLDLDASILSIPGA